MSAWTIKAWPQVSLAKDALFAASFRHIDTKVQDPSAKPGRRAGQTLWVSRTAPVMAIAWDWEEVDPLVVVLSDPMAILTNTQLEQGGSAAGDTVVAVNTVVHRLPWQRMVRRQLSGR